MKKVENKTVLAMSFSENGNIGYYTGKRTISTEEVKPEEYEVTETVVNTEVRTKRTSLIFPYSSENNTSISNFGLEFIDNVSLRAVSSNLWTIHGQQANPHIYKLWIECISRLSESENKEAENQYRTKHEAFLTVIFDLFYGKGLKAKEVRNIISEVFNLDVPESKLYTIKREAFEFKKNGSSGYQIVKEHKYIMIRTADGNRKRVEILPKHEFVFTEWFREWLHVSGIIDDSNGVSDMLQVAKLAIWELVNSGLVNNYSDLVGLYHTSFVGKKNEKTHRKYSRNGGYIGYVYTKINQFITSEKAFSVRAEEFNPEVHVQGSFPGPEAVAVSEVWKSEFIDFILKNMKIREKAKESYKSIIFGMFFGEESERTMAEKLEISSVAVHKMAVRIKEFITNNSESLEFLKASGYFDMYIK